jgi:retron-type reverse transcriptase
MSSRLQREIVCSDEEARHKAYDEALSLPPENSLSVLRKGLHHWDRTLRNKCARAIIGIRGSRAASLVLPLYGEGLLFASSSIDLLLKTEDETLIKYLLRNKGVKTPKARAARTLYNLTKHCRKQEAERQARDDARWREKQRLKEIAETKEPVVPYLSPALISPVNPVPFLDALAIEDHGKFLYYEWVRENSFDELYNTYKIPKKSGGERQIEDPHPVLKMAQRVFLAELNERAKLHESCHGFRIGKSIITNAAPHVGQPVVLNLDLKDFFPTVSTKRICGILKSLGYQGQELRFLTDMTTYEGRLPQGAPTSPILANISCWKLDIRLSCIAKAWNAAYTRYADDISFSGPVEITKLIPLIGKIVREEGFRLALPKLRIHRKGARQDVTGLTVNTQVSVPRAIRRRLRAAVHHVANGMEPSWKGRPMSLDCLKGHLNYLASVHPDEAKALLQELESSAS